MAGRFQRGLAEAGGVAEVAGISMLRSELDKDRQLTLAKVEQEHATQMQERGFQHAERLQAQNQEFTRSENAAGRDFTRSMETDVRQPHAERMQQGGFRHAEGMQRTALEAAAARHRESLQVQRDGQSIQSRQVAVLEQGAQLDREIKQIQLQNAKDVEKLRADFRAETDPAKKGQIADNIRILTGKDNDNFLPVPLKDETGAITGYEIFDRRRGQFVENNRPNPAAATGAKWDSGSGKVFLDGKEIGSAKSAEEARTLVATARKGAQKPPAAPAAPAQAAAQPRPVRGLIDSVIPEAEDPEAYSMAAP